jgi:hypothetical protein
MRIYPNNAHEFKGKTVFTLWDHEENGGYGYFSEEDEAVTAAGKVMSTPGFYGHIPFMLLVAEVPSKHTGFYNDIRCRIELEPLQPIGVQNAKDKAN